MVIRLHASINSTNLIPVLRSHLRLFRTFVLYNFPQKIALTNGFSRERRPAIQLHFCLAGELTKAMFATCPRKVNSYMGSHATKGHVFT